MKYIGPFLRINALKEENIENQLFHLSKESLKHIILISKCGVNMPLKELKLKNIPNFDINTNKSISPLLCLYKKGSPKLTSLHNKLCWNEDKFKKELDIFTNVLMTLSVLELADYYKQFKNIDDEKYSISKFYNKLAKKQLEFYASYFRNSDGLFVDKSDDSDAITQDLSFTDKDDKFKFSNQALIMSAFYKCSLEDDSKDSSNYKAFSLDILNMLISFKDELYTLSFDELSKLCLALNVFYKYSKNEDAMIMLLDLSEFLMENYYNKTYASSKNKLDYDCMCYIDCLLFYKNTGIIKFKDCCTDIHSELINLYNEDLGIFMKPTLKDTISYSCTEIVFYLLTCIMQHKLEDTTESSHSIIVDVFKKQVLNSGIILSWPDAPNLNDREKYKKFSLNADDLLEDQNFKMPSIPTPENSELAPIFIKYVKYNVKKETFKQSKLSFYSDKNMFIFFLILYLLKPKYLFDNSKKDTKKE